jgi:hypothetical protein
LLPGYEGVVKRFCDKALLTRAARLTFLSHLERFCPPDSSLDRKGQLKLPKGFYEGRPEDYARISPTDGIVIRPTFTTESKGGGFSLLIDGRKSPLLTKDIGKRKPKTGVESKSFFLPPAVLAQMKKMRQYDQYDAVLTHVIMPSEKAMRAFWERCLKTMNAAYPSQ